MQVICTYTKLQTLYGHTENIMVTLVNLTIKNVITMLDFNLIRPLLSFMFKSQHSIYLSIITIGVQYTSLRV